MDITLLYFTDCPNWKTADERLRTLADERGDLTITHLRVESPEEAERVKFLGSPSIQVDGVDLFAESGSSVGWSCRRYRTPDGYAGAPTVEQLRSALAGASRLPR